VKSYAAYVEENWIKSLAKGAGDIARNVAASSLEKHVGLLGKHLANTIRPKRPSPKRPGRKKP
jgi:hypothetical protein